jgi:hypothetical protein
MKSNCATKMAIVSVLDVGCPLGQVWDPNTNVCAECSDLCPLGRPAEPYYCGGCDGKQFTADEILGDLRTSCLSYIVC